MLLSSFEKLRRVIHDSSGIVIGKNKQSMVSMRIAKRVRALQLTDEEEYLKFLLSNKETELVNLLDVISTNVTRFYREDQHFEVACDYLVDLLESGRDRIRIWCAASSTGEEPYTIAVTVCEAMRQAKRRADVKILATDISPSVLQTAQEGIYKPQSMELVPTDIRKRYFKQVNGMFSAGDEIRRLLTFKRLNLMERPYPLQGPLDLIFCRNVMIYFDSDDRRRVVTEFRRLLAPGALLIVGLSENLNACSDGFEKTSTSVYTKRSE